MGQQAVGRREGDRFGRRDDRRVGRQRARPTQDPGWCQGRRVEPDDDRRIARSAGHGDDRRRSDPERVELGERGLDLADEVAGLEPEQPVAPVGARDRDDRAIGQEPVRRSVEDPGRVGELGIHRRQRLETRPVDQAVQVPPAAPVADQVERAVGRPFGLDDRLLRSAGGQAGWPERAVGLERCDAQPGGVPRHVRVVPFEPGQLTAVRRQPGRGDEVGPADEDRRVTAIEWHGHDRVRRQPAAGVILADGHEPSADRVGPQVGVAPGHLGGDGHRRLGARVEPVESAVAEVREDDDPAGHDVRRRRRTRGRGCGR